MGYREQAASLQRHIRIGPFHERLPISEHANLQRQLLSMAAMVELGRALNIACARVLDLSQRDLDEAERKNWSMLGHFLLSMVKDGAAGTAVDVSSQAIQVLGGAG